MRESRAETLTYAAADAGELEALEQLERDYCALLDFALVRGGNDVVTLLIMAQVVEGAAHLLAPFLEGTESQGAAAPLAPTDRLAHG